MNLTSRNQDPIHASLALSSLLIVWYRPQTKFTQQVNIQHFVTGVLYLCKTEVNSLISMSEKKVPLLLHRGVHTLFSISWSNLMLQPCMIGMMWTWVSRSAGNRKHYWCEWKLHGTVSLIWASHSWGYQQWWSGMTPLTHLPLDKMVTFSQTIFWDEFSWMKNFVFWLKFHWSLFLRVQLTTTQHWFR